MRKYVIVAVLAYLIGLAHMYHDSRDYYKRQLLDHRDFYWNLITTYQKSLETSRSMTINCGHAYTIATRCLEYFDQCPVIDTANELIDLNEDRITLKTELDALEQKTQTILESRTR